MKKVILTASLVLGLFLISLQSQAQIKYYSPEVMDEINATDEQRAAVKELSDRYDAQFKALKKDKSLSKDEAEAQRKKLTSERSREYWKILNPEQTKYLRDKRDRLKAEQSNK